MANTLLDDEHHAIHRVGWLRAAVLGANDGIVSTASLLVGIAAATADKGPLLIAGVAALVAGAMSMAAGEYVSVSSQSDTEKADLTIEAQALKEAPQEELIELAQIYETRGLDSALALQVAEQLTAHDALGAHARDELGISEVTPARPIQAALYSAICFAAGSSLPLMAVMLSPLDLVPLFVAISSLLSLAVLGYLSAQVGGAGKTQAIIRIVFWGAAAMTVTYLVGAWFGTVV